MCAAAVRSRELRNCSIACGSGVYAALDSMQRSTTGSVVNTWYRQQYQVDITVLHACTSVLLAALYATELGLILPAVGCHVRAGAELRQLLRAEVCGLLTCIEMPVQQANAGVLYLL